MVVQIFVDIFPSLGRPGKGRKVLPVPNLRSMYWERPREIPHGAHMVQRKWQQEEQKPQTQLFDLTLSTLWQIQFLQ